MSETPIEELRTRIDEIDRHIVDLLHRRTELAIRVGQFKRENNLPLQTPEREAEVLERIARLPGGAMPASALKSIYEAIMRESLRLE